MDDSRELNLNAWNERASAHAQSPDYAFERFLAEPDFLSGVVRFDRPLLGDIAGQRAVHLQCHIGTDTISLARLGAEVTGLDFSAASLAEARKLASATGTAVEFVEGDVYDAAAVLGRGRFDLVYTGIGALCWLPDIDRWAGVVAELLAPGGRLFVREGHPMLWTLDEKREGSSPNTPTSSARSPMWTPTVAPTWPPTPPSSTRHRTPGTTVWASSSRRC